LHSNMIIVVGTLTIFLVGILFTQFSKKNKAARLSR
jgi:cbb3-type cytochrome oxidase subunit 3